jgi:hypothetical protein
LPADRNALEIEAKVTSLGPLRSDFEACARDEVEPNLSVQPGAGREAHERRRRQEIADRDEPFEFDDPVSDEADGSYGEGHVSDLDEIPRQKGVELGLGYNDGVRAAPCAASATPRNVEELLLSANSILGGARGCGHTGLSEESRAYPQGQSTQ